MKKQLLIAAVAASMTSVAMADISITGQMKVNYKNTETGSTITNAISHEANLYVDGKSGNTTFHMELDSDSGDFGILATENNTAKTTSDHSHSASTATSTDASIQVEDIWMKTSIADIDVKAGTWNGSDTLIDADSARAAGKFALSTDVSGLGILVEGTSDANKALTLSGEVAGVSASYKMEDTQDTVKLATTVQGITVAYHGKDVDSANYDESSVTISGSFEGVDLTYAQADADSLATIAGDSILGDAAAIRANGNTGMQAGDDLSGVIAATSIAGNKVKVVLAEVDSAESTDTDITKFVVTRPLAAGATLEVTYTEEDNAAAANDKETLDVELAVKF